VLCLSQHAKLTVRWRKSAAKHTAPSRACPFQVLMYPTIPSRGGSPLRPRDPVASPEFLAQHFKITGSRSR
jgi:hypothetical protein